MSVQSTNYQCVASLPASQALPTLSSLSELKRDFPVCVQRHSHRFPQDRQVTSEEAFLVFQRSALIEKTSFSFIWLPPHLGGGKAALLAFGLLGELAPGNQVLGGSGGHCNRFVILLIFFWQSTFAVASKDACTSCVATWTTLTVERDSDSDSYFSWSETKSWNRFGLVDLGEGCLPQGCTGSRESQSEVVSFYPYVDEVQPETQNSCNLTRELTLSHRSATETDLDDTLGGDDDAAEGDRGEDKTVSIFLGDLVQVSPLDVDSRSSE